MSGVAMVAHTLAANPGSEAEMASWKHLVAQAAASATPLSLHFFGGANQVTGYRLYYMLQFAKLAGVPHVALHSDGAFWIEEATGWLMESGVDEVVLLVPGGVPSSTLSGRIAEMAARSGPRPNIIVRPRVA